MLELWMSFLLFPWKISQTHLQNKWNKIRKDKKKIKWVNKYNEQNIMNIWVRSWRCGCPVTWFCYHLIAKPGNKTAAPSRPDPYIEKTHVPSPIASMFKLVWRKIPKLSITFPFRGESTSWFSHNVSLVQKTFPCHGTNMYAIFFI